MLIRKILCGISMLALVCSIANAEVFVIKSIQVSGLKRISLGAVLSNLPVKEGDSIDSSRTPEIIHALYETKFFSDVTLQRKNNDLLIHVVERAVIGSITVVGNSKISKKDMLAMLKSSEVNVIEGQPLNQAVLNAVQRVVTQQYYNLGLYDAKVKVDVKPLDRGRVAVAINIKEGPVAKIKAIKIVGNKHFKERELLGEFSLTTTKLWSFLNHADQYSKEKLDADIEKLRTYYMDRGYLRVNIDSVRVAITPDKKGIYITINITENAVYKLSGFSLDGNLIGKEAKIMKLITLKIGDVFSLKDIVAAESRIKQFLGDYGYGMPDVTYNSDVNENNKRVWIKFMINPGQRIYIRHIDFKGNYKTNDDVLRREMRLQEGGAFSLIKLNESRRRLANLGYLQDIDYKVMPVADTNNQVDLLYEVKETSAISANFQAGLSDKDGFLYGVSLTDKNFLGTGKSTSISFDNTKATQSYGLGYYDPYFTADRIGFSVNGYLTKSSPGKVDLSPYNSTVCGLLAGIDIPLSDYSSLGFGLGVEHIGIGRSYNPSAQVKDFINRYGESFNQFKLISSWNYSNFDKIIFPTRGFAQTISVEGYGPLNSKSLEFYVAKHTTYFYQPLFKEFVLRTSTDIGYGGGMGKTKDLPFFKNFTAGGIGSVRGFEAENLGGSQDSDKKSLGGRLLTVASASIMFPVFMNESVRPSIFIDAGNVYSKGFKFADLRASYGVQLEWRTPLAPLTFCLAKPLRKKPGDLLSIFQFSVSASI